MPQKGYATLTSPEENVQVKNSALLKIQSSIDPSHDYSWSSATLARVTGGGRLAL